MTKPRPVVALLCIYLTVNLLGCGSSPEQQSRDLATKITAQAKQMVANQTATPAELTELAASLEQYVNLAGKDGSLARSEDTARKNMDRIGPRGQQALKTQSLRTLLLQAAANLREIAASGQANHSLAAAHVRLPPDKCDTLEGGFLAIAAIGALAALGGVNPLGDLLGAIGAVGAFGTWAICR